MLIQMKNVEKKDDILEWDLLSFEGKLNKKLLELFIQKNGNDGKNLIRQIVSLRKKYEKSLIQIKA